MCIRYLCVILFFSLLSAPICGQDSLSSRNKQSSEITKRATKKLSGSLESNQSDKEVADNYLQLAKGFYADRNFAKAETNFYQATLLYEKSKNPNLQAEAYRELAKSQEMQAKFDDAIKNYNYAAKTSQLKEFKAINENDVNRLKNRTNPKAQSLYIQRNITLSNSVKNTEEAAAAYQQMAEVKMKLDDNMGAIDELESALEYVPPSSEEAIKIKQEIAKVYVADEQYEKAISLNKSLVAQTQNTSNPKDEIVQIKNLAHTYFVAKDENTGVQMLQQAYRVAIEKHQTMEARNTLRELVDVYKKNNNTEAALNIYTDFILQLDTLIKSDSTLIDEKFFQLHEERIKRLENERILKDKLIERTNVFNYVLLGAIVLILIFLGFIAKTLFAISKKNKKIALQSLRREMNPHFIFNSLNSVNQFIAQNNELEANKYLASYSRLMRNMMENSNRDFISLATEIEQIKEYLQLEHMRFGDKFRYETSVDESLDTDVTYIPNMIIQPQLENAIWHGLRYKEKDGLLILRIEKRENKVCITIEDNGIGLKRSREIKTKHQKQHNSRGLNNTYERIHLLNELYRIHISMQITEKEEENTSGVVVKVEFPFINKKI